MCCVPYHLFVTAALIGWVVPLTAVLIPFQAHSDDDDGQDDVAVNVDNRELFMDDFFAEVCL